MTTPQARRLGATAAQLARFSEHGALVRLQHGLYVVAGVPAARGIDLPRAMHLPSPSWTTGHKAEMRQFSAIPQACHDFDAALEFTAACLNPLLNGEIISGSWDAQTRLWRDSTPTSP